MSVDESAVLIDESGSQPVCRINGAWTVGALRNRREQQRRARALQQVEGSAAWDLSGVTALDSVGALMLWQAWGNRLPDGTTLPEVAADVFAMLQQNPVKELPPVPRESFAGIRRVGDTLHTLGEHSRDLAVLLGQLLLDTVALLKQPLRGPWREISAQVYHTGARALPITALVGFLIGVVLSYLSAQQLQLFGASVYIVDLLGISIVRELGPVLAAILVAGRSGSAITAQIGVMRVTQELDAMHVMGISPGQRLVLPRVGARSISLPLVVLWTDFNALLGGALVAAFALDLSPVWFALSLREVITLTNFWIGLGK